MRHFKEASLGNIIVGRKKHLFAGKGRVLIDDNESNISEFIGHGGYGFGWAQPWNCYHKKHDLEQALVYLKGFIEGSYT